MSGWLMALLLHTAATLMLCGLIWFVQVVHYPMLRRVGAEAWPAYAGAYVSKSTWVLLPLMIAELGAALWLSAETRGASRWLVRIGLAYLLPIWISTFFVQGPCHRRLQRGWDEKVWQRLVTTNWIRTVAWSVRGVIAVWLVWVAARL